MEDVLKFLESIVEAISSLIDFVISFVSDLVYVIGLVGEVVLEIPSYFSWLPESIVAMIVTIFAIVVIYKILGREG